jgi:hypothetical protein
VELSLEDWLICCGIEERVADIIEAGLDHTLKIDPKKGALLRGHPIVDQYIYTHVVLLLEMESDSISDNGVDKLMGRVSINVEQKRLKNKDKPLD